MSNRPNHRRGEGRRTEHGPRFEDGDPGKGCNSPGVARGRKRHKRIRTQTERRKLQRDIKENLKEGCTCVVADMSGLWQFPEYPCPVHPFDAEMRKALRDIERLKEARRISRDELMKPYTRPNKE